MGAEERFVACRVLKFTEKKHRFNYVERGLVLCFVCIPRGGFFGPSFLKTKIRIRKKTGKT